MLEVLQAVDRPDRLEASYIAPEADPGGTLAPEALHAGASLGGELLFEGRIDRAGWGQDAARGRRRCVVAYAAYHYLRAARRREMYYQVTDAEIAHRIASELELVPVVEPVSEVHASVERDGDPLLFLRRRARRSGRHFGVSGGRLYFTQALPDAGEPLALDGTRDLLALEVWRRRGAERGGVLETAGDPRWRPLRPFTLDGTGAADGRFRAVRCAHRVDASGYRSEVEFLEAGIDVEAWRRGGEP